MRTHSGGGAVKDRTSRFSSGGNCEFLCLRVIRIDRDTRLALELSKCPSCRPSTSSRICDLRPANSLARSLACCDISLSLWTSSLHRKRASITTVTRVSSRLFRYIPARNPGLGLGAESQWREIYGGGTFDVGRGSLKH